MSSMKIQVVVEMRNISQSMPAMQHYSGTGKSYVFLWDRERRCHTITISPEEYAEQCLGLLGPSKGNLILIPHFIEVPAEKPAPEKRRIIIQNPTKAPEPPPKAKPAPSAPDKAAEPEPSAKTGPRRKLRRSKPPGG